MATDGATAIASLPDSRDELTRLRQENESLRASGQQSSNELQLLRGSHQQSSNELQLLRAERQQLLEDKQYNTRMIEQLQHQLQCLLKRLYGRSSEKIDHSQMLLFETLLNQLAPPTP